MHFAKSGDIGKLGKLSWLFVLIILFFQSILHIISILSNIALLFFAFKQLPKMGGKIKIIIIGLVWVLFLEIYSLLCGNDIFLAIRFGLIILFIIGAYLWNVDYVFFFKTLFHVSFLLIFALICLECYMLTLSNSEYLALRNGLFRANDMGDVFWYEVYYKLELRGTSLIVFVYMLSYVAEVFPNRYKHIIRIYYLVGAILAGNFAYQMAIIIFHIAYYIFLSFDSPSKLVKRVSWFILLSILIGGLLFSYITSEIEAKSDHSNAIRYDQVEVLWNDLSENPMKLLFGTGLGHTIEKKTSYRDYRGNTYFELQTLYFFNQLGLFNFTVLVLINIYLTFRFIKAPSFILLYGVYITYACSNPYIWDTNHVVVITSLLCAKTQIVNTRNYMESRMIVAQ